MLTSARVPARRATGTTSGGTGRAGAAGTPAPSGGTTARAAATVEFALTGGVLFVLVTAVRWVMASPPGLALPDPHLQLAAVAVIVGAALAWALSSPWGRRSGGHLNPAATLALWVAGAFPGRRVLPYMTAQLTGSLAGTGLARLVWGPVVGDRMAYAAVRPAPSLSAAALFTAEAAATAAILAVALLAMSRPAWTRWIPAALPFATAVVIVILGTLTGGSANPARQFGPAVWAHQPVYWSHLWIYLVAPLAGAALPALVIRYRSHRPRRSPHSPRSDPARLRGRRSETDLCADGSTC
ncbi:aquaporin [Kitasatospora azatica]|uniref:aquaporin n=1 Tax=Kitasatospora azatica TaxID=58347 RepID=UPI0018DCFA54|nr:aquaporin [Kitasatospora azatica]